MTIDYSKTIHLPKTDFPRRAGLAQKEPQIQARWDKMGLYDRQRQSSQGRKKFILHMGPPFANGNIHLGHVLSTVLKDMVCRSHQMMGFDAPLVPGFDCHGLPIEWKVEENFRAQKSNITKDTDRVAFLKACREFAAHWIGVQSTEFQRLGILGDWQNPYRTMDRASEATIAATVHKFLRNGALYRGSKPVMWSVPEQTALAEAEIEYKDITSDTVMVAFPVKSSNVAAIADAAVVIWTTTPWTLPGNRAIGFGEDIDYTLVTVTATGDDSMVKSGQKFVVAEALADGFIKDAKITAADRASLGNGVQLAGTICHHPLHAKGYDFDVPLLAGDFVTTDAGTGFVHIAPGHGEDDHRLGVKNGIEIPETVTGDGKYTEQVPLFAGIAVYTPEGKKGPANKLVMAAIAEEGYLASKGQVLHSYPHSWRSKAPVIFRTTPQWFVSMEKTGLRQKALGEIDKVTWYPARGKNRIGSMVEGRGDWCVSRQRVWGVPLAIFVDKKTNKPLEDEKVLARIIEIFEKEGSESWFDKPAQEFLGPDYSADDYEQVRDIVDVWMESGITQEFVLKDREELCWPADLYLEGSDQHRGWFQSSLLVACGTAEGAPYKNVLTHGFILDEKGYKMSKSQGNVTAPAALMEQHGADILRLWVAGSGYTEDIKFGTHILQGHIDIYRRIRGTFCYLLGSLQGDEKVGYDQLSDMDKWVLHKLHEIDGVVRKAASTFDYLTLTTVVHNFCARELSALYFDVCKDTLYCDAPDDTKRRAVLTVLDEVFVHLAHWLAPVICYTAEEAWLAYKGVSMDDLDESIHLSTLPPAPDAWHNPALDEKWQKIFAVRRVVNGAIEVKRFAEKEIGASLEAALVIYVEDAVLAQAMEMIDLAGVCITSSARVIVGEIPKGAIVLSGVSGVGVVVEKASGDKCARCWKYTPDVGHDAEHATVCARCAGVVRKSGISAAA